MSALLDGPIVLRAGLVALSLYVASALWDAYLSPLARQKVPGPFHARFSRAWLFGKVVGFVSVLRYSR